MRNDLYISSIPRLQKNIRVFAKKNYIFFVFLRVPSKSGNFKRQLYQILCVLSVLAYSIKAKRVLNTLYRV
jgi:hypothetical protein